VEKKMLLHVYNTLISTLKDWRLYFNKFLGFGLDGASVMVGSRTGVATQSKKKVNPYLIVVHYVAHMTNFASLEATKGNGCSLLSY